VNNLALLILQANNDICIVCIKSNDLDNLISQYAISAISLLLKVKKGHEC
jgi:hypothetical protein